MRFTAVFVTVAIAFTQANVAAARVLGQPAVARADVKNDVCLTSNPEVCGTNVDCISISDANPLGICVDSDAAGLPDIPDLSSILCDNDSQCEGGSCEDPLSAVMSLLSSATGGVAGLSQVLALVDVITSSLPIQAQELKFCVPAGLGGILSGLPL